jgi:lysophospholipase L1-like esterase
MMRALSLAALWAVAGCGPEPDDTTHMEVLPSEADASPAHDAMAVADGQASRDGTAPTPAASDAATATLDAQVPPLSLDAGSDAALATLDAHTGVEASVVDAGKSDASPAPTKLTLWIAGDSTVMTYPASDAPQEGWGQEIGALFSPLVSVNNQALGGRSTRTFMFGNVACTNGQPSYTGGSPSEAGTRWERIRTNLKAGDYLLIQFGHNDAGNVCERHVALPEFTQNLAAMIRVARERSATPILITPMSQLSYANGMFRATLTDYAAAMKETAASEHVELVDLNTLSIAYYRSKGFDYVANQVFLVGETTHFQKQGAIALAQLITQALHDAPSNLTPYLK